MSANILTTQYMAAKQAMIDGYRGMHKAPEYLTWNEVQDLQEKMQSAAVALAEYMVSIKDGSWREALFVQPTEATTDEAQLQPSSLTAQAVDEIIADESAWTTPADESAFENVGNSGDYLDQYDDDEYDDNWPEQSLSRWVVKCKNGHVSIGEGILSRYRGEDWGEASGWSERHINLNQLYPDFKKSVLSFVKDLPPGHYDLPYHFEEDDEDEDDAINGTLSTNGATSQDEPKLPF